MENSPGLNGHLPRQNGNPAVAAHSQAHRLRVPTVNEALPYTPFSSIVPFNPNLIPPPSAIAPATPTAFEHLDEIKAVKRELAKLTAGAGSAEQASQRCQKTLRDVKRLLDPASLARYTFKRPARRTTPSEVAKPATLVPSPALSTFAKMVLDSTQVPYRHLTPESMKSEVETKANPPTPEVAQVQVPFQPTRPLPSSQPKIQQASVTPSQPASHPRAFVLPPALTPAQRAEYQYVAAPESSSGARDVSPINQSAYLTKRHQAANVDQRQKSDAAVEILRSLMSTIFEAEYQMQPDTSGDVSMHANSVFISHDSGDGSVPVLQSEVQSKLDGALQKVFFFKRLESVEIEDLARLQRLCESAVAIVPAGSLEIGSDWTEQDSLEWLERLARAENGLVAARSLMRIMTESAQKKELQSEDSVSNALDALRFVTEQCIIPVVEERSYLGEKIRGEKNQHANPKYTIAAENSKALKSVVQTTNKTLRVLGELLVKSDVDERTLSSIEYLCKMFIFAEASEKDSALGAQTFEGTRKCAMDVLTRIFTKYTGQRDYILQEILMSLEKLPATKQSARQFKLPDAKPIQLVSALLMRLVQTSATETTQALRLKSGSEQGDGEEEISESDQSEGEESEEVDDENDTIKVSSTKKARKAKASRTVDLASIAHPLNQAARHTANYIVSMLLQRALAISKSSEEPFRKLLDIFTDDFLNVLGSSDWPAAELLLRTLVIHLIGIAETAKSPAPSRTLALELLGTIGSGILDIRSSARNAGGALEGDGSTSDRLAEMARRVDDDETTDANLAAFDGPYRVLVEYLLQRAMAEAQLHTVYGYHLMQWAQLLCDSRRSPMKAEAPPSSDLQNKVKNMIMDPHWLEEHHQFPKVSTAQGQMAAKIVAAKSPLCKAFNRIFSIILSSMTSEQPTIRSRSLKSVTILLENDPSVLDRNSQVLSQIVRCMGDPSPLVRDSALTLVEKCVSLRPALDLRVYERVISRTHDAAIGVRKRAMRFLKQVYLRHEDNTLRSAIANSIMMRIKDSETSVADIARETMEDIWFSAFRTLDSSGELSVDVALRYRAHAALIIATVNIGDDVTIVLEGLVRSLLSQSKQAAENVKVSKTLVHILFDGVIDNSDIPGTPPQSAILRSLTIFAKADPYLFTASQLESLEPYVQNLDRADDLDVYHHAVTVLRHTMPCLTAGLGQQFLTRLQKALLGSVGKITGSELAVIAPCLWEIDKVLQQPDKLTNFMISVVNGLHSSPSTNANADQASIRKLSKLLAIAGQFGKSCNFEAHLDAFKARLSWIRGKSVSGVLIDVTCKFTSPKQPVVIREAAVEAISSICQTFPEHLLRPDVLNAIETVFKDKISSLEYILLISLEVFFAAQESSEPDANGVQLGSGIASGSQRLTGTYKATEDDKASTSISQRFLPEFLRLALSSMDEIALCAARIVVSINRQGRTHPRESGPALVALETCPTSAMAKMAFVEHKNQAAKHESVVEKELIRGIQQAFDYQRRVVGSTTGFTGSPPTSKLHLFWDVLKGGKAKVRTKFFTNLCTKLDFDPVKLDLAKDVPMHLQFVRFSTEAIAFLDFDRIEEILHLLSCLEKTFAGTGTSVAQIIESEVLNLHAPLMGSSEATANTSSEPIQPVISAVDPARLQQLAVSAQILSLMWECRCFLLRLWNVQKYHSKPKNAAKETNRAPNRATSAPALTEAYLKRVEEILGGTGSEEALRAMCAAFVELINVDNDVKVADEEDEGELDVKNGWDTRSEASSSRKSPSTPGGTTATAPRGKKRKSTGGAAPPNKKSRGRKSSASKALDEDDEEGGWE